MYKRKIVHTGPFDPLLGDGVSSSTFDLLRFLNSRGHEVFIISFMPNNAKTRQILDMINPLRTEILSKGKNHCDFIMSGINVHYELLSLARDEIISCNPLALNHYLKKIQEYSDGYFLTIDTDSTCLVAHSILGTSSAHFIHSPAKSIGLFDSDAMLQKILRKQTVFTVSKHSQMALWKTLSVHSHVWPPFIDPTRYKFPRRYLGERKSGYYSAGPHKGDNIINLLVKELPDHKFVIMGKNPNPAGNSPNVKYLRNTTNMNSFYGEISLLLVPSLIPEGYPRVIMEAAFNGIPTIANRIGGIPEVIGSSGILIEMESPDKMVEKYKLAIVDLLNNQEKYKEYSNKALARAEIYRTEMEQLSIGYDELFF